MHRATIYVHPEIWRTIWNDVPTVENAAQGLLLPAEYKVVEVKRNLTSFDHIEIVIESERIPEGVTVATPVYTTTIIERGNEPVRREVTFDHMEMQ